jgi:hypothetical protein
MGIIGKGIDYLVKSIACILAMGGAIILWVGMAILSTGIPIAVFLFVVYYICLLVFNVDLKEVLQGLGG